MSAELSAAFDRVADEFNAVRSEIGAGGVPSVGGTFTGRVVLDTANEVSLTSDADGSLRVGTETGQHLAIDNNEIQSKATGTTAGNLYLNPHGGTVRVGEAGVTDADLQVTGTLNVGSLDPNSWVAGALTVGASIGASQRRLVTTAVASGAVSLQSISGTGSTAHELSLNPSGGAVTIGSGLLTANGKGIIASTEAPALTSGTGALNVGSLSGAHVAIGANDVQAKSNATTATGLDLNPLGGTVTVGGRLVVADTEASLSNDTGAIQIGANAGNNLRLDQNEVQASAAGVAATFNINPHGGDVLVGTGLLTASGKAVVASTEVPALTSGTGATNIGAIAGTHIAIGGNDLQAKTSATAAGALDLNPLGGAVTINAKTATVVETGTWTASFTGFVIGTGGTQTENTYTYVGGPNVGDSGHIVLEAEWTLGTGATYWATGHRFSIPSGYVWKQAGNPLPGVQFDDVTAGIRYFGVATTQGASGTNNLCSISYMQPTAATGAVRDTVLSSTVPLPWASGDKFHICIVGAVTKV